MKKIIFNLLIGFLFLSCSANYWGHTGTVQKYCKVIPDSLIGEYYGECKKGFAWGKGKAIGIDMYNGDWRKGKPHGSGIYWWEDGSFHIGEFQQGRQHGYGVYTAGEKVIKGYWKRGIYTGIYKRKYENYTISRYVSRVTFIEGNNTNSDIEIMVTCSDRRVTNHFPQIFVQPTIGYTSRIQKDIVSVKLYGVKYPFRTYVIIPTSQYDMFGKQVVVTADFEIIKPGIWQVNIELNPTYSYWEGED